MCWSSISIFIYIYRMQLMISTSSYTWFTVEKYRESAPTTQALLGMFLHLMMTTLLLVGNRNDAYFVRLLLIFTSYTILNLFALFFFFLKYAVVQLKFLRLSMVVSWGRYPRMQNGVGWMFQVLLQKALIRYSRSTLLLNRFFVVKQIFSVQRILHLRS